MPASIDRERLRALREDELARYADAHPSSHRLFEQARASLLSGVPMNWMTRWAGQFPVFVREARGARVVDVDGHELVDFCLGDTGAMAGHSDPAAVAAIAEQAARGITTMLPTEDAAWVGAELTRRFGLPYWQFALTATDANRFVVRLARELTGRPKVLVHNWCYHGSVDETIAVLDEQGTVRRRPGNIGPPVDPSRTTAVVEINDLDALERALEPRDVACVLFEPALTNIGIVLPDPGYHDRVRELTRATETLLVIDETHTICAGPGGYTRAFGLEPDLLTVGKSIASGVPAAAFGFTRAVADTAGPLTSTDAADIGGIGGTLAGNALSIAAMRATLAQVLTGEAFERMIGLATRFADGVRRVIAEHDLPWHITQLGCRTEYLFQPAPPHDGGEAHANWDSELDSFMHLFMLNRGILLTPFHLMALMCPATAAEDVDRHTAAYAEAASTLVG